MASGSPSRPTVVVLCVLYHGTDLASANDILSNGLDATKAAAYNVGGELWASEDPNVADIFAQVSPAGGVPARFEFEIDVALLRVLQARSPAVVVTHVGMGSGSDYEFLPGSFPDLNQYMTGKQVVLVP